MSDPTLAEQSLALHRQARGKIGTALKVPLATRQDLSLAYTPGVAAVSQAVAATPAAAYDYTLKGNTIAVVSDGSAVLGLGNLGPLGALPVMEGKAALFKKFADVDAVPLCLATQDSEEIIATVKRIAPVFGGINLEDISAPRCFMIEERLRAELDIPVMHDDQHGTAIVVLAGLINALRVAGRSVGTVRLLINGTGAAGTAIAKILADYGCKALTLVDSHGVLNRERRDLNEEKIKLLDYLSARGVEESKVGGTLEQAIHGQDVFIGVSKEGLLTPSLVKTMAEAPIIFAMANPVPEIMPDEAHAAGALIVATGRSDFPNQVNNVLAFPGLFRGALDGRISQFNDQMFIRAAEALARVVSTPSADKILPDPFDPSVVPAVAGAVRSLAAGG